MKTEKITELIKKAFDWYYEEGIYNTNIDHEEAIELFKTTQMFIDWYYDKEAE